MTAISATIPTTTGAPAPIDVVDAQAHPEPVALAAAAAAADGFSALGAWYGLHPDVQQYAAKTHGGSRAHAVTQAAPPPAAPPMVYDVETTTQAQIDALKASRDEKQQRLGWTIENAKVAYGDLLKPNAKGEKAHIVVTTSQGNGGQPVLVLTGPGFRNDQPARVHTHYHGDNATVADPLGSKAGTNARIRDAIARNPQTVFVLPEAAYSTQNTDSPTRDNHYRASWAGIESQVKTTEDGLHAAGITNIGKQIVSVHSRGGSAIQRLMERDATGSLLRADRLEMHDSLYGSQGYVAQWGATANGKAAQQVVYYRGNLPQGREAVIQKAFGSRFEMIQMSRQPKLDDTTNPVYKDANNQTFHHNRDWKDKKTGQWHVDRPIVRQFDQDPHYRTTGQFLDTKPGP